MSDLEKAKLHLKKDLSLKPIIQSHELKEYWGGQTNLFLDLIAIVTGQQLSLHAANTIYHRFLDLFEVSPTSKQVLDIPHEHLRTVGLSNSKANYVKNIATSIEEGNLNLEKIRDLSDQEIVKTLTSIKGLGPWSAEMFLIFSLRRSDVFSIGDLGVRTAISRIYGIDREDKNKILAISQPWAPYRSFACRFLWASLDNA